MKLVKVNIENFRGYREPACVSIDAVTTIIGRNDAGKSTLLEALDMFFNDGKPDRSDACVYRQDQRIRVSCVFGDLPSSVVIDSTTSTSLESEYLLNEDGLLEICKEWDVSFRTPKESVHILANHPSAEGLRDLLSLKNSELKERLKRMTANASVVNLSINAEIRKAIRNASAALELKRQSISLDKEDGRQIWERIKALMPMYALFKSDRPSHDGDDEIQSPLKLAVAEALKELAPELKSIEEKVRARAENVANRTLDKLKEMDANLASELKPFFRTDPKWDVFRFGLCGDNGISVNKRGSGVRRLILLNFFRAEAERRRLEKGNVNVIYAIEEPETSQHPSNQKLLVEAINELASDECTQVLLTSHTPSLAGSLPLSSLRYVRKQQDGSSVVSSCTAQDLVTIANDLGVTPDKRVQVIICVEGANDIEFLVRVSKVLKESMPDLVDLSSDRRVVLIPLGGGSLQHWVSRHYLESLGIPEVHIYDRDDDVPPKYQNSCNNVNNRGDGSWAVITTKREMENYLHQDAIELVRPGVKVSVDDYGDLPLAAAKHVHEMSGSAVPWSEVLDNVNKLHEKVGRAKRWLNREAASSMTVRMIEERDPSGELVGWLRRISSMLK